MDSNLNLAKPFSIFITRHWSSGWEALNGLNQSKAAQSWCEKWNTAQANFNPNHDPKHVVVTVLQPTTQSQPSPTIHYTNIDRLEGLRCCYIPELIQKYPILIWNVGAFYCFCRHPWLKSCGVVKVIHDGSKSQPCKTIQYTYNKTLEWLGCSEWSESVQSYSILVWKVEYSPSQL